MGRLEGRQETMTGEKFTWEVIDNDALFFENDEMIDYDDVVERLNELHDKNKRLKLAIKALVNDLDEDYIIVERSHKNLPEPKVCRNCMYYEIEYDDEYDSGEYVTTTQPACRKYHDILDESEATECPDYEEED